MEFPWVDRYQSDTTVMLGSTESGKSDSAGIALCNESVPDVESACDMSSSLDMQ